MAFAVGCPYVPLYGCTWVWALRGWNKMNYYYFYNLSLRDCQHWRYSDVWRKCTRIGHLKMMYFIIYYSNNYFIKLFIKNIAAPTLMSPNQNCVVWFFQITLLSTMLSWYVLIILMMLCVDIPGCDGASSHGISSGYCLPIHLNLYIYLPNLLLSCPHNHSTGAIIRERKKRER